MKSTVIQTRPGFAPWRWLLRWYIRQRLRSVEFDLDIQTEQELMGPRLTAMYEREAAYYRVQLAILSD